MAGHIGPREDWNAIVQYGNGISTLIDDLEWRLFESRRNLTALHAEAEERERQPDIALAEHYEKMINDTRVALGALYAKL